MDSAAVKNLMQLKGVGIASARRLVEAGIEDFATLADSGEETLRAIKGLNPRSIPGILTQAAELAAETVAEPAAEVALPSASVENVPAEPEEKPETDKAARLERVGDLIRQLQQEISVLAVAKKGGKKGAKSAKLATLQEEAAKLGKVLQKIEAALPARLKRTGKALAKADRRLAGLAGRGPKKTAGGLKKTRKSLKKVLT